MDDNYQNYKKEIEKINQRVKEYLWKKQDRVKTSRTKFQNARSKLLARSK